MPIEINSRNIDKIFNSVSKKLKTIDANTGGRMFLVKTHKRILSNRYCGIGRPKKSDYDYKRINWRKMAGNYEKLWKEYLKAHKAIV